MKKLVYNTKTRSFSEKGPWYVVNTQDYKGRVINKWHVWTREQIDNDYHKENNSLLEGRLFIEGGPYNTKNEAKKAMIDLKSRH